LREENRKLKPKSIAFIMMLLILVSTLNLTVFTPQLVAENTVTKASNETFAEAPKTNQANSTYNVVKSGQLAEDSSKQGAEGDLGNIWNFNDTSEWSKSAYMDGNKTRLIVGVNGENHTSFLELEKTAAKHQAKIVNTVSIKGEVSAVVVELPLAWVTGFVEETRASGLASYIEPNMKVQAQFVPNDPYWSMQWGPQKIGADWAWNTTMGNHSVLVAVVDTGIDYTHPDLAANYAPLGYDWVNNDSDPKDDFGHGTHCAGIIAAVLNNSVGIAGVAQVRIMAEKVLDSSGWGYDDWVANGIINATDCGANIISMSLGGYGESELLHDAVKYAYDHGVLLIAAAGNDDTDMKSYPAAYDEVVAVAATDQYDNKAYFSNWGDWLELAAPGVDVYSTMPTYHVTMNDWGYSVNYSYMSGTSMACPHVAGVAALLWSLYPNKSRDWVRMWLRYTADDLGDPGFDIYYGYGRVNARKAFEQTPPTHDLIAYEWTTPPYIEPGALGIINATILNFGESNETSVSVRLLANGTLVNSTSIGFLAGGNSATISLAWNPTVEGLYNVTLYVVPVLNETSLENNVLWKYIYVGFPVKAVVLRSAGNIYSQIITNWQVLNTEWYQFGHTMVYVDYTTLNKDDISYEDIAATKADVLIISCAYDPSMGWQFTDSEIEAITQYLHEGHGLIATAGTFYSAVPNNNKLAPLFGLNETTMWTSTGTDLLHLLNTTHPIFTNVPNPLVFPQVATVLPQDGRWDSDELVGGKYLALGHYQESAIVTYRGLVYISPWLEIIPAYYHHHLQLLYNAITWSRYQKPEHELVVSLERPPYLEPGESTMLNATVSNQGLNNETNVKLYLSINGTVVNSTIISELLTGESYTINYLWATPPVEATYNVTAYAPPVQAEEFTYNNKITRFVKVAYPLIRPIEGQWANYALNYYNETGQLIGTEYLNFTYDHYVEPHLIYITLSINASGSTSTYWMIVNIMNRWVESGIWAGMWYPGWIETNITLGSTINLLNGKATVSDSKFIPVGAYLIDCWELLLEEGSYQYTFWYDKASGLWISMECTYSNQRIELILLDTNIPIPKYERNVAIASVKPSKNEVLAGDTVDMDVVAENQGNVTESFTVTTYASFLDSTSGYYKHSLVPTVAPKTQVSVVPSQLTVGSPNVQLPTPPFTINITVQNVTDLYAWQIVLHYNSTILSTREDLIIIPQENIFKGKVFAPAGPYIKNDTKGTYILFGATLVGNQPGVTGSGVLCQINFTGQATGTSGLNLGWTALQGRLYTKLLNSKIEQIPISTVDGSVTVLGPGVPPPPPGLYKIGTKTVTNLPPGERITLTFTWNTTGVIPHDYVIWAEASVVPGETNTANNKYTDGIIKITKPPFASFTYSPSFPKPGEAVTFNATSSTPNGGTIVSYYWNFGDGKINATTDPIIIHTYAFSGLYNVTLTVTDSEGLTDSTWKTIYIAIRDIAVINVTPSTDRTYIGCTISINVTILNEGEVTETFGVILYYNITAVDTIGTQLVTDLLPGEYRTLTFLWNTTGIKPCYNYTITAYALPVLGETDIADNTLSSPTPVKVKLLGDINGDGIVDIFDIALAAKAFGSYPGHPRWNLEADINSDGVVDIVDIATIAKNFGKTYP
jgi:thermitase